MKAKLTNIIKTFFPEELFAINERHEKIGAYFFEVRDKSSDGSNILATFHTYEEEPETVCIEINNVMRKTHINDVLDTVSEALEEAIELREKIAKLKESQGRLIQLEQERKEEKIWKQYGLSN